MKVPAKLNEYSDAISTLGDRNHCSVFSVAAGANVSCFEAFDALEKAGRIKGRGASFQHVWEAFYSLGYILSSREVGFRKTVKTTLRTLDKDRTYVVFTRDHVFSVVDGVMMDEPTSNRLIVKKLYELVKLKEAPAPVPEFDLDDPTPVVIPAPKPASTGTIAVIHATADRFYAEHGKPTDCKELRIIRKAVTDYLVANLSMNKGTISTQLSKWVKKLDLA